MDIFIGIDPGADGALAVLTSDGRLSVIDNPTIEIPKGKGVTQRYDETEIVNFLRRYARPSALPVKYADLSLISDADRVIVYFEENGPIPHVPSRRIYAKPATNFMQGWGEGMFRVAVRTLEMPLEVVNPKTWQPAFLKGRIGSGSKDKKARKRALYDVAQRLFPEYAALFRGPKGGLKDGRVDAALIAEFGRRSFTGQLQEAS